MKTKTYQETAKIATTFRCTTCRKRLVLEEVRGLNIMMFGCDRCQCYVIVTPNRFREYIYHGFISWKRFMKDLYASYLEARKLCK